MFLGFWMEFKIVMNFLNVIPTPQKYSFVFEDEFPSP